MPKLEQRARTEVRGQIRALTQRAREVQREIGNRVISGEDPHDLRSERSALRERLEDLHAADAVLMSRGTV